MGQLFTGYYIHKDGRIINARGLANSRVQDNLILLSDGEYTGFSIDNGRILNRDGEYTGYTIVDNAIFGPFKLLPWLS